jgi:hypothetical protein
VLVLDRLVRRNAEVRIALRQRRHVDLPPSTPPECARGVLVLLIGVRPGARRPVGYSGADRGPALAHGAVSPRMADRGRAAGRRGALTS